MQVQDMLMRWLRSMGFGGRRNERRAKAVSHRSPLPKMASTPEGRRESPYYHPVPYGDRHLRVLDKKK